MCANHHISVLPLSLPSVRKRVEDFLAANGLRLDPVDCYVAITRSEDSDAILAGGGLSGNVIKCVAVSDEARSEGLTNKLISQLISIAGEKGYSTVKLFTKPTNVRIFSSLGFSLLAEAGEAVLMENGLGGLDSYLRYLRGLRREGRNGAIVMNANPFTRGHRYLVSTAASRVDNLYVIVVREDLSRFPYSERKAMVEAGCAGIEGVTVCEGSDYAISAATFPTYFLKKPDTASDTQMTLDIDLFIRHIAPSLGVSVRFAGSEPTDMLTSSYNAHMAEQLPRGGIDFVEIPRLEEDGVAVSASALRKCLDGGDLAGAVRLAYTSSLPFLLAELACKALKEELDTTPKPGLVDRNGSGAHKDMDYALMLRSIAALRPYFARLAAEAEEGIDVEKVRAVGIEAEEAMLRATGGVNTHKGALFCLGLTLAAASRLIRRDGKVCGEALRAEISATAAGMALSQGTHGGEAVRKYKVAGALENAREAYPALFADWLPYYRSLGQDPWRNHRTLLRIMSVLDDTNVLHRNGPEELERVKAEAAALAGDFSVAGLEELDRNYIVRNTSPGGSADMLSLTILISLLY